MMKPKPDAQRKIDVHAHYLPPGYADEMRKAGMTQPDGMPDYPQWSPQLALEKYDEFGIETAILDVLHADGIGLKTNALGIYLGDPRFDPIFQELNRRKATVFIHPTSPTCWQACAIGYPRPLIEFPFDTARAVSNLIFSGTIERCPNLRIIVSHNGGVVPFLADRITKIGNQLKLNQPGAQDAISCMRRLYYDTAMAGSKYSLSSLLQLTDVSHIIYGSDWPWYPEAGAQMTNQDLEASTLLNDQQRRAIYRENALSFLPGVISRAKK
ncbi:MAG: amidohydrolase family protein [Candidatus Binatus sp.]